jgi:succinate dehydrogenase flavin-adding protein (antitoxin of CptAB toxin-antitoxin module)
LTNTKKSVIIAIMLKKETRDAIRDQALAEIAFARNAKKGRIQNWWKNEDLYYSKKVQKEIDRANVNLNEAQSFVTTFLSRINNPFNFKYVKGEEADLQAAQITNALKDKDLKLGRWNFKAMLARIQLILYGRYIFEYHADSEDGYRSHLSNVDVYQFLIDPSAGGGDIEKAYYMGRGGIIKSKEDIKEGIKSGKYLKTEGNQLISGSGNVSADTEEDKNASNRWSALLQEFRKVLVKTDQYKFWEWYTTYEGERYYVLITEDGGQAIRIEPLKNIFKSGLYPFFTVAAYPDLTEFWTPSPMDGVREAIMAKSIAINQMLDNGEAINRPMKAFDVDAIKNPALLKYRRDGLIPVKAGTDINKAIQFFPVTPIQTAIQVYDKLDEIVGLNSGVTSATKGQAQEKQVGIYEGNQANLQDRFSLFSDSEADGQQRFAELYLAGLDEHLKTKVAIEMVGIDGVKWLEVSRKDIKRGQNFDIMVITAGAEERMQTTEKRNKLTFLSSKAADQTGTYNKKVLAEMEATIAGFTQDEIKAMTDVKNDENAELMAECAQDIQDLLAGKSIPPNQMANTAYLQKMKNYMKDNSGYLMKHPDIAQGMFDYMNELSPIVSRNMVEALDKQLGKEGLTSMAGQAMGMPQSQAAAPGMEQPVGPDNTAVDQQVLANYGRK